ncbi:AfsA-related hotdog domain-containing protein [Streptomyces sp. NPDC007905]|uniref:AfsA-related hotdog domain-containing protein n=1 Tax=Streptomyces sp. NPDC007905 TaxID=3364788 RepID=UPI0036EBB02B
MKTLTVGDRRLSLSQTVPCSVAHRRAVAEVFVTDSARLAEDTAAFAFQVPRAHSLWGDRLLPYHDPFGVGEAARQAAFVLFHEHLDVPVGVPFSMQRWDLRVTDLERLRDNERAPLEGVLTYRITRRRMNGALGSLTIEGALDVDGATAVTVASDVVFTARADYEALRAYQRGRKPLQPDAPRVTPYAAEAVGRSDRRNVVIGPAPEPAAESGSARHRLVVDFSHPAFFDHSYDHVPGPLMNEALRQAALVTAHQEGALSSPVASVVRLDASFRDFAEFEGPLEYTTRLRGTEANGEVLLAQEIAQFGTVIATAETALRP